MHVDERCKQVQLHACRDIQLVARASGRVVNNIASGVSMYDGMCFMRLLICITKFIPCGESN